ncbi:MAG TPA: patatin-like phospholipase family protein [Candidatus Methylomirabilis sp.]|nr:patatin-like phospholipase family protein [Candidatus Methylomirabilis sp.]
MKTRAMLVFAVVGIVLTGCFSRIESLPSTAGPAVFAPLPDPEPELLVGVAISGGGSRAAVFAAGVLEELARTRITGPAGERSLLEKVHFMSSVSGGSLATAYYAALKPPKTEPVLGDRDGLSLKYQEFFEAYRAAMQENFERSALFRQMLFFRAFNPTKLAHSLAEVWDEKFFHGMTFATLYERERRGDSPRVILNGTSYNSGKRFALTTLPPAAFDYDIVGRLIPYFKERLGPKVTPEGLAIIVENLTRARERLLPLTFEQIEADHQNLRLALGVATSASFPPIVGPVTYSVAGRPGYQHIGDGGLFDNLGTESLTTMFLNRMALDSTKRMRALIIVIDAAYPFDVDKRSLNETKKGYTVFSDDPSRIVGIMEERANAYQLLLWDALRTQGVVLPSFKDLRIEVLRHIEPEWQGAPGDLPDACRDEFPGPVTPDAIRQEVTQIPTRFRVTDCHAALLITAARKVVEKHRGRIVGFVENQP